jgi:hypothetical protein
MLLASTVHSGAISAQIAGSQGYVLYVRRLITLEEIA